MPASAPAESTAHPRARRWSGWIPLALAIIAFIAYWPSLKSDFVYDGRIEILDEGFVTNLSNLPAVLSLKVLGMHTMLGPRPGDILYLMLIAAACGTHPFGFHLGSNLLHAANVALLFILLRRLAQAETTLYRENAGKIQWAIAVITLLFALHPISVETVAEVSYSADLLVVFFTLLALLAATAFRPGIPYRCLLASAAGILCSFASVISKESGIATAFILMAYWFLYRRGEAKMPWLLFLGGAVLVSGSFLFALSVSGAPELVNRGHTDYLGGSFLAVFWVQPRLWVFMMGQLLWPTRLSGLYTLENLGGLSSIMAVIVLAAVVSLQARLACKSRLGALGMAVYWSGLALVSNFIPLFLPLADRFYYLPLVGVAMQLVALLLLLLRWHWLFWGAVALVVCAIPSLACLTVVRQAVFATELAFWSDTVKASQGQPLHMTTWGTRWPWRAASMRPSSNFEKR